jgi:predicted nuclease of restriction endonuclease-like (RecB) superfamily
MPDLGAIGDVGSQIQQYCSLLALAKISDKTLVFSKQSRFMGYGLKFAELLDINLKIMNSKDLKYFNIMRLDIETINLLSLSLLELKKDFNYCILSSRFDLYTSWYNHIKDTVDNFNYKNYIIEYAKEFLENMNPDNKTIVSLHVRRGDYLNPEHSHFNQLDINYYEKALLELGLTDFKLLIFSNDIPWCQNNLSNLHSDITYSVQHNYQADMAIMSHCNHNIIANSSFSWWAAYLNKNPDKRIVCPKNYLQNHPLAAIINEKYYPDDWISI